MISLMSFAIPISILVMSVVYFRGLYNKGDKKLNLKKGLVFSVFISVFCFVWIAFVVPVNNLKFYSLLFDIRSKFPDKPMVREDVAFFKGARMTCNYFELDKEIE